MRLETLLAEFGIEHLRRTNALALSGGERRRVEIARALAADPAFMLLDEPFAGVDPIAVADVKTLVRALTNRGIGVLMTDHSVRETLSLVDRAYLIHGGQVMIQGKPETITADPEARRVYLGEPSRSEPRLYVACSSACRQAVGHARRPCTCAD